MATTGALALERIQAGLESTRGTAVAATRRVYGERGPAFFEPTYKKEFLNEANTSYIANYRHVVVEQSAKLTIPAWVTAADLPWWGQLFWKGSVAATGPTNTSVYTYTFTPTVASDDLKTATFEVFTDTQGFQIPFALADKLEISWQAGKPVMMSAELIGNAFASTSVTGAISDRTGLNAIAGATAQVYIDAAGGTIGNTAYNNVVGGKITWQNKWMPINHSEGTLAYDDAVRETRSVALELDVHYKETAELAQLTADGERLIRVAFTGPAITSSSPSTNESIKVDFYGFYLGAAFSANKAIRMVKLTGESQYDTAAGFDWKVTVANGLSSLP